MASSYWFLRIVLKLRSSVPVGTDTHESFSTSCSSGPRPEQGGSSKLSGRMRYDVPCFFIDAKSRSRNEPPSARGALDCGGDAASAASPPW